MQLARLLVLAAVVVISAGCQRYSLNIDAYTNPGDSSLSPPATIHIVVDEDAANPMLERQLAAKIEKLLVAQGYTIANADDASFFLSFAHAMGDGVSKTSDLVLPSGTEKTTSTTTVDGFVGATPFSGTANTTTSTPSYVSIPITETTYASGFSIAVYDGAVLRNQGKLHQVWQGSVGATGKEQDIRTASDYMIAGVMEYFGSDTGKTVKKTMFSNDDKLKALRE